MTYYRTELMDRILTDPTAQKMVGEISPIYGNAKAGLWLFQAMGVEVSEMIAWCEEYKKQGVPQTATWGLHCYEQSYALPSDEKLSDGERRAKIMTTILTRAPMNPEKVRRVLTAILDDPEASVIIRENKGKNKFEVLIHPADRPIVYQKLFAKLNDIKPAHLVYEMTALDNGTFPIPALSKSLFACIAGFYPRYNFSPLFWDGTGRWDGQYWINGYKSDKNMDFYPVSVTLMLSAGAAPVTESVPRAAVGIGVKARQDNAVTSMERIAVASGAGSSRAVCIGAAEERIAIASVVTVENALGYFDDSGFWDSTRCWDAYAWTETI